MICGSVGLKDGVIKAIKKIFEERNMNEYVDQLLAQRRILIEVWG